MSEKAHHITNDIAAYYKPVGPNAADTRAMAENFQEKSRAVGINVHLHPTEPDHESTLESLAEAITTEETSVIVFAGDGSGNTILRAALECGQSNPITLALGGNACDLAHQLHTRWTLAHPEQIFMRGYTRTVHPLHISAWNQQTDTSHPPTIAFAYWGMGASAEGASEVADDRFREKTKDYSELRKFISEAQVVYAALRHAQQMTLTDKASHTHHVVELNVLNGSREAKVMHVLQSLFVRSARIAEVRSPNLRSMLVGLARVSVHPLVQLTGNEATTYTVETSDGKHLQTQFDGELRSYHSGTTFTIATSPSSVNVITTRRRH